jgi:hypothetical protein
LHRVSNPGPLGWMTDAQPLRHARSYTAQYEKLKDERIYFWLKIFY